MIECKDCIYTALRVVDVLNKNWLDEPLDMPCTHKENIYIVHFS